MKRGKSRKGELLNGYCNCLGRENYVLYKEEGITSIIFNIFKIFCELWNIYISRKYRCNKYNLKILGLTPVTISSRKFPPKKGVDGDISKGNKRELSRERNVRSERSAGLLLLQTENLVSEWVMVGKKQT